MYMSQIIASKLSVSPKTPDCVMLESTNEELKRFKFLNTNMWLSQSRLIKYLNRLTTPLLHYVDIILFYNINTWSWYRNLKRKRNCQRIKQI